MNVLTNVLEIQVGAIYFEKYGISWLCGLLEPNTIIDEYGWKGAK